MKQHLQNLLNGTFVAAEQHIIPDQVHPISAKEELEQIKKPENLTVITGWQNLASECNCCGMKWYNCLCSHEED